MPSSALLVLLVGATGSVGQHVVAQALALAHRVRALVRDTRRAALPPEVELASGDLTDPATLVRAVDGVDAVVFTHGPHGSRDGYEQVDYGGVRNVLTALAGRPVRIALMTAIGVTDQAGPYNRSTGAHDWKR